MCLAAGLLRLKGAYDPTEDMEEMKREKDEADREPRISIFSLVKGRVTENTSRYRKPLKLFHHHFKFKCMTKNLGTDV